jgi:hypothetical protein
MRFFSPLFALAGILIFIYAIVGRFLGGVSLFGFETENIIIVANTLLLIAVITWLYGVKHHHNHK